VLTVPVSTHTTFVLQRIVATYATTRNHVRNGGGPYWWWHVLRRNRRGGLAETDQLVHICPPLKTIVCETLGRGPVNFTEISWNHSRAQMNALFSTSSILHFEYRVAPRVAASKFDDHSALHIVYACPNLPNAPS
jgi:hypothetical protein